MRWVGVRIVPNQTKEGRQGEKFKHFLPSTKTTKSSLAFPSLSSAIHLSAHSFLFAIFTHPHLPSFLPSIADFWGWPVGSGLLCFESPPGIGIAPTTYRDSVAGKWMSHHIINNQAAQFALHFAWALDYIILHCGRKSWPRSGGFCWALQASLLGHLLVCRFQRLLVSEATKKRLKSAELENRKELQHSFYLTKVAKYHEKSNNFLFC